VYCPDGVSARELLLSRIPKGATVMNGGSATLKEIGRWLPALEKKPEILAKCYELFATAFEPTLRPLLPSISSILNEVALQDPRAREIAVASIVEKLS